jgi:hypothetical protein
MGRMLSERMGSPIASPKAKNLREIAGVPKDDAADNPSYRELQEAMTKDRYNDPWYVVRLIEDPAQIAREQTTLDALRLQTMSDIYRRSEEMLFMEASEYSRDLTAPNRGRILQALPIR